MPLSPDEAATLKSIRTEIERLKGVAPQLAAEFEDISTLLADFAPAPGSSGDINALRKARQAKRAG